MQSFVGTFQNRLDAKGRVSIPAPFRAVLRQENGSANLYLRPSHLHPCIDALPERAFNELSKPVEDAPPLSDEQEDLALTLYGGVFQIEADKEGRIVLPADLVAFAQLVDTVTFMGLGKTFQIWEPALAVRRMNEARARTAARKSSNGVARA
jgi:MraZ protein